MCCKLSGAGFYFLTTDFARVLSLLVLVAETIYPPAGLQSVCQQLPVLRPLCPLPKREWWVAWGHRKMSSLPCGHDPSLTMKTWTGSYWQLAEVSLFRGHCWSCMMLMMDSSSFHITHLSNCLLNIALVWVIIRALLIKPPLISCGLITVLSRLKTELRCTKPKGSPSLLPQGGAGWQRTALSPDLASLVLLPKAS